MAFPSLPTTGQVATINGITYVYDSTTSSWTRSGLTLPTLSVIVDTFTGDGVSATYTLSITPVAKEYITVNIDGVMQQKTAYTLSNNILSLTGTPIKGAVIEVKTTTSSTTSILTGLVFDTFTGDGTTTTFTLSTSPTSKNYTIVTIGGVVQQKINYSVVDNMITFSTAPLNTSPIEVITLGPAISSSGAIPSGSNTQVQYNNNGALGASSNFTFNNTSNTLTIANVVSTNLTSTTITSSGNIVTSSKLLAGLASTTLTNPVAVFSGSGVNYDQVAVINSTGTGSADLTTYGNNGDDTQSWTDIGFTGNSFSDANYTVTSPGDGYLFVQGNTNFGGNLVIATGNTGTTKDIVFATGGFQTSNIRARMYGANGAFNVLGNIIGGNISTTGTLTTSGNLYVAGWSTLQQSSEVVNSVNGATGVVVHDLSIGSTYYHTSPSANFTVNFTNVPTTDGRITVASFIVVQGATAYIPNAVQIAGVAQTIKWQASTVPAGTANKSDIFSFSLLRVSGAWVVYGQAASYG